MTRKGARPYAHLVPPLDPRTLPGLERYEDKRPECWTVAEARALVTEAQRLHAANAKLRAALKGACDTLEDRSPAVSWNLQAAATYRKTLEESQS